MLLFVEIIRFWDRDTDFSDNLLDEKVYNKKCENIWITNVIKGFNGLENFAY